MSNVQGKENAEPKSNSLQSRPTSVTFEVNPTKKPDKPLPSLINPEKSVQAYIERACRSQGDVLQASFGDAARTKHDREKGDLKGMFPVRRGGLVDVATHAYNGHYHLVIRPDDVWITILSQFSFYVNAHAEELRHLFVAHEGKKELVVGADGNRYSVDFGRMAQRMTDELHKNVKDPELRDWILAEFSTTTIIDTTIYAIQMMATLKKYFNYTFRTRCGLPGVTLEGTEADWESVLMRIDKLEHFGDEPKHWARMLRTVLSRFLRSYRAFMENSLCSEKERNELRKFWGRIASNKVNRSGRPTYLSGWIAAFCPWNADGKWIDSSCAPSVIPSYLHSWFPRTRTPLFMAGIRFPIVDMSKVPCNYVEVVVKLDDNGVIFETSMVAGHLGGRVLTSGSQGEGSNGEDKRLGVASGWFVFIK